MNVIEEKVLTRFGLIDETVSTPISSVESTLQVSQLHVGEIAREAVKYVPQDLTDDQKRIACENIGLGEMAPSPVEIYENAKGVQE